MNKEADATAQANKIREEILTLYDLQETRHEQLEILLKKAEERFNVPIAFYSFLTNFPSKSIPYGKEKERIQSLISLYHQEFKEKNILYIQDARADPLIMQTPLFQLHEGTRFYAIAAIVIPDGLIVGEMCLLDTLPHAPCSKEDHLFLLELAHSASTYIQRLAGKQS